MGIISPDTEEMYRSVDEELKNNIGNQILVVKKDEIIEGCPGIILTDSFIDQMYFTIQTELRLGILKSGLELDVEKGKVVFPTEQHVRKDYESGRRWELIEGPISFTCNEFMHYKEVDERKTVLEDLSFSPEHSLTIYLGNEVEKYFDRNGYLETSYVEALNLLECEAPERFKKKYEEELYQTKTEILSKLEELDKREADLRARTDTMVFPIISRIKLNEIRKGVQKYLAQAIELGMHQEDSRIELKPGIEVNVPVYISKLCEKYQVNLPSK
ncbi:MAG: hypothetical protein ACTSV6_07705 [Candidatus Heimdallarchaeota archaeon]